MGAGARIAATTRLPRPAGDHGRRLPPPLLAAVLAIGALTALPLVYLALRALSVEPEAIELILRPRTIEIMAGSVALGVGVAICSVAIGVPLAWLTARTDLPGRRLWTVLTAVPLAVPSYVMAFAFVAALGPRGALSEALRGLGLPGLPSIYGLGGAVLVLSLATYPYVLLATRAALLRADPQVEEAGRALGDTPLAAFRRVALPLMLAAVTAGALLAVLYALSDFGAVAILQFDSFARAIYVQYRASFDRSLAAILALILVGATLLVAWGEARIRARHHLPVHGPRRPPTLVALGAWRWPALAFCAAVVALALVVPAGTIVFWLVRGAGQEHALAALPPLVGNTFGAGLAAAVVAAAMALPVAALLVGYPGRLAAWIERLMYGAYAVPGIVLALAAVTFVLNVTPIVYQTLLVLVLAYAVRFLPQAVGPARTSLAQVGPRLGEAARTLGETPAGVLRTITLPLLRPGIIAGMALVFLTTVKELPLTLLLGPTGFATLATRIWGAATEGFYAQAALPAALLMLLSAGTVALLFRAEDRYR